MSQYNENVPYSSQCLIPFLRELTDNIENNTICPKKLKLVGEFYMSYIFQAEVIDEKNKEDKEEDKEEEKEILKDKDLMKFMVMGYYIYCHIIENKSICLDEDISNSTGAIEDQVNPTVKKGILDPPD